MNYELYLALGDSMSIDAYAGPGLGAPSLLYRNDDRLYPEFTGCNLSTQSPECRFLNLAKDGGTVETTKSLLKTAPPCGGKVLITLTVGGNDLLAGISDLSSFPEPWLSKWQTRHACLLDSIRDKYPKAQLLVGNVYDVTDETGNAQSQRWQATEFVPFIARLNATILANTGSAEAYPVDIHRHFLGHAVRFQDPTYAHYDPADSTCWVCLDIEPNARGSSEIRRLFWDQLVGQ